MALQALKLDFYKERFCWNSKILDRKLLKTLPAWFPSQRGFLLYFKLIQYLVDDDIYILNIIFMYHHDVYLDFI